LKSGESETVIPQADLRITNAALGGRIDRPGARSSVQITYDKFPGEAHDDDDEDEEEEAKTTILCSLTPGSVYTFLYQWCVIDPPKR
jgi:FK506-binding nuclear protein